jgi:hypothetical protein
MKIIITESQNNLLRRVQQFIDIVEDIIEYYEEPPITWWCNTFSIDGFVDAIQSKAHNEFRDTNYQLYHDSMSNGGKGWDAGFLYDLVEENYGNYLRNLYVRKCDQSRF